jgi:transposase
MNATGTITMTMREVDRFKVIQAVTEARLKPGQAAERLGLCVRQVERLVQRYEAAGVAGLVSGKRGRPGNHQLPAGKAQRALRGFWSDAGVREAARMSWH